MGVYAADSRKPISEGDINAPAQEDILLAHLDHLRLHPGLIAREHQIRIKGMGLITLLSGLGNSQLKYIPIPGGLVDIDELPPLLELIFSNAPAF